MVVLIHNVIHGFTPPPLLSLSLSSQLLYIPDSDSYAILSPLPTSPEDEDKPKELKGSPDERKKEVPEKKTQGEEFIAKGRSSSLVEFEEEITDHHVYLSSKFMSNQVISKTSLTGLTSIVATSITV